MLVQTPRLLIHRNKHKKSNRRRQSNFFSKEQNKIKLQERKNNETEISNLSDKEFSDGYKNAQKSQKNGLTQGELQQIS